MDQTSLGVDAIFQEALEKDSPAELSAYLDQACNGDVQLRGRVERLLHANADAAKHILDSPPSGLAAMGAREMPATESYNTDHIGTQIGPYKLLQKLGEGGMGTVYMAEQKKPVARRVALKIIKPGMDSGQVIARFEAERQALAMMDHPCIAKIFDAGATSQGRPYFVMELVKGVPITQYCDENHFTPKQRLELFIQVCQAVQHAHQKGIIHRDIKPQNILVADYDHKAVPKVIDFGIAKATTQSLTEKTLFTEFGQLVGTLEYMSPEQAKLNQLDIDTRTDVYSLGVLLYQLLTGVTPFETKRLRSAAFDEMLRIIREEEPPKPSTRISTWGASTKSLSDSRRMTMQKLKSLVQGDLDWIVMKAIEKDRARRYETANAFADDVQRYLSDELVSARPPSAAYRFRKFARRNRTALTIVATLLTVTVGLGVLFGQLERNRQAAMADMRNRNEASVAVGRLLNATPNKVGEMLSSLPNTPQTTEVLEGYAVKVPDGSDDKNVLHARLALAQKANAHQPYLLNVLLSEKTEYLSVICEILQPNRATVEEDLWEAFHHHTSAGESDDLRFRAGTALASLVPESERWEITDFRFLAEHLVLEEFTFQKVYRDLLRPLLNAPDTRNVFLNRWEQLISQGTEVARVKTAQACADFGFDEHARMARLLSVATPGEVFDTLFASIAKDPDSSLIGELKNIAAKLPVDDLSSQDRVEWGRERAGAGIALLRLGEFEGALATFHAKDDPEATTQFIHGCKARGVSADEVLRLVELSERQSQFNDSLRYALTLLLGEYEWKEIPDAKRQELLVRYEGQYQKHRSSAIHSATGWLLRAWKQDEAVTRVDQTIIDYSLDREWFNVKIQSKPDQHHYFTFVVFQPGEFEMGSKLDEPLRGPNELPHTVRITRPFALLDREIGYMELLACNPGHEQILQMFSPPNRTDTAGPGIMWYDSVRFCQWITTQFGLSESDQAYPLLGLGDKEQSQLATVELKQLDWAVSLERQGFRLPTEAEWEYACRSGMRTPFSFGGDEELLGHYAWFATNSEKHVHEPKQKRPNPRGLFDMHGNLFEWCNDRLGLYPVDDLLEDYEGPRTGTNRVLRGGCWGVLSAFCRSSNRISMPPETNFIFEGIRLCITLPSVSEEVQKRTLKRQK